MRTDTLLALLLLAKRYVAWIQPKITLHHGFVDIYSPPNDQVDRSDVVGGRQYSLDIFMDQTDRYDYLIQHCSYNNKYNFIDKNSCLVCDSNFQRKWENDEYQYAGVGKRTIVHFLAPEPLQNIECSVRVIKCCGCAERACVRNVLPIIGQFQQQVVNINLLNAIPESFGSFIYSPSSLPWWAWLLIALAILLLLCLLLLPLLYFCCKDKFRKRGVEKGVQPKQNGQRAAVRRDGEISMIPAPTISRGTQDVIREPRREPAFRTPSESPSESAHSSASQSRSAVIVRQQPSTHPSTSHDTKQGVATSKVLRGDFRQEETHFQRQLAHEKARAHDHYAHAGSHYDEQQASHIDTQRGLHNAAGHITTPSHPVAQSKVEFAQEAQTAACGTRKRSTSQERFFQKNDRQRGLFEEGYDQAQCTFTTRRDARSEIV
uniref:Uncharacterized protein n=1 Tax=Parascaris univalens TaxID=6257 RepID=A0A915BA65_PARUN